MKPVLLIANPTAGRRRPEAAPERILGELAKGDVDADLSCTERRGDAEAAARQARDEARKLIVVAGGDGTLNEVANGLIGAHIPVCLIPCGTENVVARELGVPLDVASSCALAAAGAPARPVDAGLCGDRAFLLAAGIGFDAAIVRGVSLRLKQRLGEGAYWVAGLRELLRARPAAHTLRIDGDSLAGRYYGVIVANTSSYAGRTGVFPGATVDDGLLDVHPLHARGYLRFVWTIVSLLRGRPATPPDVGRVPAREVVCQSASALPVQLDGDDFADTPVSIRVAPQALHLLVPPATATGRAPTVP